MKRSWFVIAGGVALVVIGSIVALMSSGDGSRRQGALGSQEPVALSWRGDWIAEAEYTPGSVVSYEGASYVAEGEKLSTPNPGCAECGWALLATESPPAETQESAPAVGQDVFDIFEVHSTALLTRTAADTTFTVIPGLTKTLNFASDNAVYVHIDGGLWHSGTSSSGFTLAEISVFLDGGELLVTQVYCEHAATGCNFSRSRGWPVSAGNHTIEVRARHVGGDGFSLGGPLAHRGTRLTVLVLKK